MINVILMAGKGQRFVDAGYSTPKPLLPVLGKSMIARAIECMPSADQWIFVIRKDYAENTPLLQTLHGISQNVVVLVDEHPTGQLDSCLLASQYYNSEEPLFIGACDFGMIYDESRYGTCVRKLRAGQVDIMSWSFTHQSNVLKNPNAWGWLKEDSDHKVLDVSVKVPISNNPYEDSAITGSFSFRSGKLFLKLAEEVKTHGLHVGGEYYIDSLLGIGLEMNLNVVSFPVHYIGWGTPADYEEYLSWENIWKNYTENQERLMRPEFAFWKNFFETRKS